ncbi:MAG: CHAT domain-containing protein [Acidobacteriota bacterium]
MLTYHGRGELPAATRWLDERLEHDPGDAYAHWARGLLAFWTFDQTTARSAMERAVELDPELTAAAADLGLLESVFGGGLGEKRLEDALARWQDEDEWGVAAASHTLGTLTRQRHDLATAMTHYEAALSLRQRLGDTFGELATRMALGGLDFRVFDLEGALAHFQAALALQERIGDRLLRWNILANIGTVQTKAGDLEVAETTLRRALGAARQNGTLEGQALVLGDLAIVAGLSGRARLGQQRVERARGLGTLGPALTASLSRIHGWLLLERGRHQEARASLDDALSTCHEAGLQEEEIHVRYELAKLALAMDQPATALDHAEASIELSARLIPGSGPFIEELRPRLHRAEALRALEKPTPAWDELQSILGDLDVLLGRHGRSDHQLGILETVRDAFAQAVRLVLDEPEACGSTRPAETSLVLADASRARVLNQLLTRRHRRAPDDRERRLVGAALREINAAALRTPDDARLQARQQELQDRLAELLRREESRSHQGSSPALPDLDPKRLQSALPPNTALLSFFVSPRRSHAWLVTRDGLEVRTLTPTTRSLERAVTQHVASFRQATASSDLGLLLDEFDPLLARRLHRWLVGPFEKQLVGIDELVVVPDGVLHYLPFETLVTELDAEPEAVAHWTRCRYLVERFVLRLAPSLHTLQARRRRPERDGVLALGAPVADAFPPLPASKRELDVVATTHEGTCRLAAREATVAAYREHAGSKRLLHLATHALTDDLRPDSSGLVLSSPDHEHGELLHAHEIAACPLAAELVVLSGCQTGTGRLRRAEGFLSLARAFLLAGAESALVSLWNAHDATTLQWMADFHEGLSDDQPAAVAATHAKRAALAASRRGDDPLRGHPLFWAAFVLVDTAALRPTATAHARG